MLIHIRGFGRIEEKFIGLIETNGIVAGVQRIDVVRFIDAIARSEDKKFWVHANLLVAVERVNEWLMFHSECKGGAEMRRVEVQKIWWKRFKQTLSGSRMLQMTLSCVVKVDKAYKSDIATVEA